ncbi:hypothetical protein [Luteibaculum oceani]|uniref:Uncharacterized protein n=1 Tax=Luteibaculum oceani TaxID=1294296 RepID=A0A5C6VL93_9FLAO|nr:hypothetical protein [Luteibaculum oceani]TXC85156.1 hypothetical protein FRX97_00610 [Luteibaculum oceani]
MSLRSISLLIVTVFIAGFGVQAQSGASFESQWQVGKQTFMIGNSFTLLSWADALRFEGASNYKKYFRIPDETGARLRFSGRQDPIHVQGFNVGIKVWENKICNFQIRGTVSMLRVKRGFYLLSKYTEERTVDPNDDLIESLDLDFDYYSTQLNPGIELSYLIGKMGERISVYGETSFQYSAIAFNKSHVMVTEESNENNTGNVGSQITVAVDDYRLDNFMMGADLEFHYDFKSGKSVYLGVGILHLDALNDSGDACCDIKPASKDLTNYSISLGVQL